MTNTEENWINDCFIFFSKYYRAIHTYQYLTAEETDKIKDTINRIAPIAIMADVTPEQMACFLIISYKR